MSSWETVAEAKCTENGEEKRSCLECGFEETRIVAATGHSYKETSENNLAHR
jgi:hypothetical protein